MPNSSIRWHEPRVEYLNSKYASYAYQSDSDSIYPFSAWGNSAHCHQRPGPWRLVRPGAEARRLINFCAKFVRKFSAETFHASLRFEFALVVVI